MDCFFGCFEWLGVDLLQIGFKKGPFDRSISVNLWAPRARFMDRSSNSAKVFGCRDAGSRADFGHTVAGLAVFWGGHVLFWCCQDFNDHMVSCFLNPLSKSFLWSFRIIPLWIYGMFRHTKWCLGKTWPFSQENQLQPWLPCRPSQTSALPFKEDDWVSNFFYGHCGRGMMKNHMNLSNVKFM